MNKCFLVIVLACCILTACSSPSNDVQSESSVESIAESSVLIINSESNGNATSSESLNNTEETSSQPALTSDEIQTQRKAMESWIDNLDTSLYAGLIFSDDGQMIIQVTNIKAFEETADMSEAKEKNWKFNLELVQYSFAQLEEATKKLWREQDTYGIGSVGPYPPSNSLYVLTSDMSKDNLKRISEFVGIENIHFEQSGQVIAIEEE